MKKILLVIFVLSSMLAGCDMSENELSIEEITIDEVSQNVKEFVDHVTILEEENGNGIYMYDDTEQRRYLFLNQDFLDEDTRFGEADIEAEENAINIYVSDQDNGYDGMDEYKLYEIILDKNYEFMNIFKNEEETHFQGIVA